MDAKMTAAEAARFLNVTVQAIHKRLKTKNLIFHKSQNRVYFGHETARELFSIHFKPKIIGLQNLKGGVGKTELVNVCAVRASLYGARVLCIDLDMQGNLTSDCFKIDADKHPVLVDVLGQDVPVEESIINVAPGIDLMPSRIENGVIDNLLMLNKHPLDRVYKELFSPFREKYDLILIDCPPALGQSVAAATLMVDEIISPVTPDKRSLTGLKLCYQELENIKKKYHKEEIPLKIILNQFDTRNGLSHETDAFLKTHEIYKSRLYKGNIRKSQDFPNAVDKGHSIFKTLRDTPAKEDIDVFVQEMLGLTIPTNQISELE